VGGASLDFMELNMSKLYNNLAWNTVGWTLVRKRVLRIQHRIFSAKRLGNNKKVIFLQRTLINSLDAKLLAVLQVTTLNQGRKTAGVDKQVVLDPATKLELALNLVLDGKASPIRRIWIPKPGKTEKRPLGIPTITDLAKQQLATFAVEPEWEALFEPNSYGFRKGRSCHDAIEAIFLNLHHNRVKYVYDADISKCFDRIDHDALLRKLDTFPQMEQQIRAWLQAGIMEGYANKTKPHNSDQPNKMGTSQGGIISPLLANVALHGLEIHLKDFCANKISLQIFQTKERGKLSRARACGVVRYADDFVIIHENKAVLELCIAECKVWLQSMGLEISEEKSKFRDIRQGFNFLGFQIIYVKKNNKFKVKIIPAKGNRRRFLEKVRLVIISAKAWSAFALVRVLRPITIGWANYYSNSECQDVFHKLDHLIFCKLRAWAFRRDTRNGRIVIKEKYFPARQTYNFHGRTYKDNWILAGQTKENGVLVTNFLPRISWIESRKHVKIVGNKSPFDGDHIYWGQRLAKYSGLSTSTKYLLQEQKGRCAICKDAFTINDRLEVDHIIPKSQGGKDIYDNLQLLHKTCHLVKTRDDSTALKALNIQSEINQNQKHSSYTLEEIYENEGF
jgi:RNA-directed DNA polymerase